MNLLNLLLHIPDPRTDYKVKYPLQTLLFGTLCGILCGCQSWLDISDFCESKKAWLSGYIDLSMGVPSCWTFRRLFTLLDPDLVEQLLLSVSSDLLGDKTIDQVSIDGKYLRGSRRHDLTSLKSVSAWCHEHGLVLGAKAVADGSHESTTIPLLLDLLKLKGTTVSIDAAGCQASIAQSIIDKGGNYVLALKKNQPKLHHSITGYMQAQAHNLPHLIEDGFDDNHGRSVRRRYFAIDISHLDCTQKWSKLKTAIAVETISSTPRTPVTNNWRYYLSSHSADHPKLAGYVRNHWSIENRLHWVLDVQLHEDDDLKAERRSARAFATLRRIALNIVKTKDQTKKRSTRRKMLRASWNEDNLLKLLT